MAAAALAAADSDRQRPAVAVVWRQAHAWGLAQRTAGVRAALAGSGCGLAWTVMKRHGNSSSTPLNL